MSIKDLIPRIGRNRETLPATRWDRDPFDTFQREMNSLFSDFFGSFDRMMPTGRRSELWEGSGASGAFTPKVDVSETDTEVVVAAELPGMDEKDVSVEVDEEAVTLRGEKKAEREEKQKNWYRRELSYGSFQRIVPLTSPVELDKVKAQFRKGVLTVTLPKRPGAQSKRKAIEISAE